jgi:hypothetical protein
VSAWLRSVIGGIGSAAWLAGAACTSAWNESGPPPFTAAETNRALAPVKEFESRCYEGSDSQRAKRVVRLEYVLYVDEHGAVRSDPIAGDLEPRVIECMRAGLDSLKFPAKRERDQLRLDVQLGKP